MLKDDSDVTNQQIADLMEAARLVALSNSGELEQADQDQLQRWVEKDPRHARWIALLKDKKYLAKLQNQYERSQQEAHQELQMFRKKRATGTINTPTRSILLFHRWWAVASILLLIGAGTYIMMRNNSRIQPNTGSNTIASIAPGKEGALLTLSDGRQVNLDSISDGLIASQNGSKVVVNNGLLSYDLTKETTSSTAYNTIMTPKGRQFSFTLPDGTKVWLNAASSIRYPTVFNEKTRNVFITGEVYLEVATDKSSPFFLSAQDMEVQVLGTSFNVYAYDDEPAIKTTLLNGSIKVLKKSQPHTSIILQPEQQAVIGDNIIINKTADIEKVVAWKNGLFNFNGATLEEFMRQIARWYDLKIIYQGAIPHKIFKGEMGRDLQLSQVMKLLTQFKIKYILSENTITITSQ